ncbi:hypothetical protein CDAR_550151 [Caerostris darwini]|uniref:Uncharacterized protein n=1 Tax=Caerostris darwini TaxID=1538125 RepID=A0AAV4PN53_9ARAC|nr:hypothetical protein CDAR_550151 [Caerostris darwini]
MKDKCYVWRRESFLSREPYLAENVTPARMNGCHFTRCPHLKNWDGFFLLITLVCSANAILKRHVSDVLLSFNYTFRMDWYVVRSLEEAPPGAVKAQRIADWKGEYYVLRREFFLPWEPYLAENVTPSEMNSCYFTRCLRLENWDGFFLLITRVFS